MKYISKGINIATEPDGIRVSHRGSEHILEGELATVWRNGRRQIAQSQDQPSIDQLCNLGLVEAIADDEPHAEYRLLTRCIICSDDTFQLPLRPCNDAERQMLRWIRMAGLRLTIAEMVKLNELGLWPTAQNTGAANRQVLVEAIYTTDTIQDGILEFWMERSPARDETVAAVLGLLKKRRLFMV